MEHDTLKPADDPREIVNYNFQKAAERLGLDSEMRILLNMPFREVRVEVPVRMDNGSLRSAAYTIAVGRVASAERLRGT